MLDNVGNSPKNVAIYIFMQVPPISYLSTCK